MEFTVEELDYLRSLHVSHGLEIVSRCGDWWNAKQREEYDVQHEALARKIETLIKSRPQ